MMARPFPNGAVTMAGRPSGNAATTRLVFPKTSRLSSKKRLSSLSPGLSSGNASSAALISTTPVLARGVSSSSRQPKTWSSPPPGTIGLDAPFTFQAGVQYDLQFVTNSSQSGQGELVALGSRTAGNPKLPLALRRPNTYVPAGTRIYDSQGDIEEVVTAGTTGGTAPAWSALLGGQTNDYTVVWENLGTPTTTGVATTCASNSNAPGFSTGDQIGGDIYLLESLAQESPSEVSGRAYEDARDALALLANWTASRQESFVFGYPFNTYSAPGIFLPAGLAPLHSVQLFAFDLLNDRWSLLNPEVYFGTAASGMSKGATTPVLATLAAFENLRFLAVLEMV